MSWCETNRLTWHTNGVLCYIISAWLSAQVSVYTAYWHFTERNRSCVISSCYIYKCRVSTERTCFFDIGGHCEIYNNHCWHQDVSSVRSLLKRSAFGNLFFAWAIIKAIVRLSEYEKKPPESKRNINDKLLVPDFVCL